jgi:HSP20 family protein
MAIITWQPLRELNTLRQQMDSLFNDLLYSQHGLTLQPGNGSTSWAPAIELQETDTDIILKAEIPGVEAKDLDVQVSQESVLMTGEHQEEKRTQEQGFFRSELRYGQFQRMIALPVLIQNDQVKAEFKDGILTLTLPKVEDVRQKMVKVDLTGGSSQ